MPLLNGSLNLLNKLKQINPIIIMNLIADKKFFSGRPGGRAPNSSSSYQLTALFRFFVREGANKRTEPFAPLALGQPKKRAASKVKRFR